MSENEIVKKKKVVGTTTVKKALDKALYSKVRAWDIVSKKMVVFPLLIGTTNAQEYNTKIVCLVTKKTALKMYLSQEDYKTIMEAMPSDEN